MNAWIECAISLAGATGEQQTRTLRFFWSEPEGCWRTQYACVAVVAARYSGRNPIIYHRALRLPPKEVAHPELGPFVAPFTLPLSLFDYNNTPTFLARIREIDAKRHYLVIAWADAIPASGHPRHNDPAQAGVVSRGPLERLLGAPHAELAAEIARGGNPLADYLAQTSEAERRPYLVRDRIRERFGFAVPSGANIKQLVSLGPWVEMGAGVGYWAALIRAGGGDIVALDKHPNQRNQFHSGYKAWSEVSEGEPADLAAYPERNLLLVWPPYKNAMADEALQAHCGRYVAYVGEGYGGATADDAFHERLQDEWEELPAEKLAFVWRGLHDRFYLFRRLGAHKAQGLVEGELAQSRRA